MRVNFILLNVFTFARKRRRQAQQVSTHSEGNGEHFTYNPRVCESFFDSSQRSGSVPVRMLDRNTNTHTRCTQHRIRQAVHTQQHPTFTFRPSSHFFRLFVTISDGVQVRQHQSFRGHRWTQRHPHRFQSDQLVRTTPSSSLVLYPIFLCICNNNHNVQQGRMVREEREDEADREISMRRPRRLGWSESHASR